MRPRREISSGELFLQSLNSFKFTTQMKLYAKIFNYLEHKTTRTLALLLLQCLYLLFSLEMYPTSTKFIFLSLSTALKLKSLILIPFLLLQ